MANTKPKNKTKNSSTRQAFPGRGGRPVESLSSALTMPPPGKSIQISSFKRPITPHGATSMADRLGREGTGCGRNGTKLTSGRRRCIVTAGER
jgi:hypothetical protein